MSETKPVAEPVIACPNCGAEQPEPAATCWLCGQKLGDAGVVTTTRRDPGVSFSLSTVLLVITLACICFALLAAAPGLGILAAVLLVPVFIRTTMVLKQREARGIETSQVEKWSLAIGSFFTAMVMATVVLSTAFAAFCFSCLAGYSVSGRGDDSTPIVVAFIVGGAVTLFMVYLMAGWARKRYRRDTGDY
jgi:hypothetical protein